MVKRVATLLGLIGLATLVCLAAALTSGCGTPLTQGGFQRNLAHGIGPVWGRLDALDRKVVAIEESTAANFAAVNDNFKTLQAGVQQAVNRAETAMSLSGTIVERLGPIGRDASVASKEATAGRKAVADVGKKVDSAKAEAATAHTALDQKVDRRADEVVGAVQAVGVKVDATKTAAETAASRAGAAVTAATEAKAEATMAKAEAMATAGAMRTESTNIQSAVRTESTNVQSAVRTEATNTKAAVLAAEALLDAEVKKQGAEAVMETKKDGLMTRQQVLDELHRLMTRPLP